MTQAEYQKAYAKARRRAPFLTRDAMRRLKETYVDAADLAAEAVRDATTRGLSDITVASRQAVNQQLRRGAEMVRDAVDDEIPRTVARGAGTITSIDTQYLTDAVNGIDLLSPVAIRNIAEAVNSRVVAFVTARVWEDGLTFSERVWQVGDDYAEQIRRTLTAGLAQGRDPVEIARDIQVYVADGKVALANRYGQLERGTARFVRRIRRNVDYRALRLVRTELYAGIQEAGRQSGRANPGATGEYDWVMEPNRQQWGCSCPTNAANGPYQYNDVPGIPHPNCHPAGTMISTPYGDKTIEQVLPGDVVISHDGSCQRVTKTWCDFYDGEVVTIHTKNQALSATVDHPIKTPLGWLRAQDIKVGDNVSCINIDIKPFPLIESEADNLPTSFLKEGSFYRVLSLLFDSGVPVPAVYFDSELYILKGEIDVESSNIEIRDRMISLVDQCFSQEAFIRGPVLSGVELSYGGLVFVRVGDAAFSSMCSFNVEIPTVHIPTSETFTYIGNMVPETLKISGNYGPRNTKPLRYSVNRQVLVNKEPSKRVVVNINSSTHNSAIVHVTSEHGKIPVYNLTVENTHTYVANGIVSHNCQCQVRPRLMDTRTLVSDLKAWSDGESRPYIDRWYREYYRPAVRR